MNNYEAILMGFINRHNELMVFDWEKAATLIVSRGATNAKAGLRGDWEWTGGEILRNRKPVPKKDTYTYLASTWAVPEIEIDGEVFDCYKMQREVPRWNEHTYWPKKALTILKAI